MRAPLFPQRLRPNHLYRRLSNRLKGWLFGSPCPVCARRRIESKRTILSQELASAWELTPELRAHFDEREGTCCPLCQSNRRSQHLASTLVRYLNDRFGENYRSLRQWTSDRRFHSLAIAELNACGQLHPWLSHHPGLAYSEYRARPPIRSEDIQQLTYPAGSFDLVLTSETLEHVPDLDRALAEIHRVLKSDGVHLFTIPVLWDRSSSRTRARLDAAGKLEHLLPPSYHGVAGTSEYDLLVITEFGADVRARLEATGFSVQVARDEQNPVVCTLVTRRGPTPVAGRRPSQ